MNNRILRLLALLVLIASTTVPLTITEAQQGRPRQRRAGRQAEATGSTQSGSTQQGSAQQPQTAAPGRRGGRRAADASTGKSSTTGGTVTVVRQINQIRLSAAATKTIKATDKVNGFVIVRGAMITPRSGSSFWSLSNGSSMILGGGTATPIGEVVRGPVSGCPACVYVQACYCPGYDPNKDDGCRFDGPALGSGVNCKQKEGVNCSCHFTDFFIMDDGSYVVVTP